tara:strand:- start:25 stop:162 length:138 start_codon:yes stop_codon:yes gene_type:complete
VIDRKLNVRAKPSTKFLMSRLLASGFLALLTTPALAQTPDGYTVE